MTGGLPWISRALSGLALAAVTIAAAALVCMTGVQAWQVFARYVLNASPSWTEPVAQFLVTTAMMFGAAVGVRREAHFGFFIAVQSSPEPLKRILLSIARVIIAAVGFVLAMWGGELLIDGWNIPLAGAGLPQSAIFLPICLGGALITLFAVERLFVPVVASATSEE